MVLRLLEQLPQLSKSIQQSITITLVNLTGTILMMLLPFLTNLLYDNETIRSSALVEHFNLLDKSLEVREW